MLDDDALPPAGMLPQRGRARSGAFLSDDDVMAHDLAALHASLEGKPLPPAADGDGIGGSSRRDRDRDASVGGGLAGAGNGSAAAAGGASGSRPGSARGQLSKKTIKIMTSLDTATARPPELAEAGEQRHVETEEEAAERELAEAERRRRAAEAAGSADDGDGAASGAGAAAGGAGTSGAAAAKRPGTGGSGTRGRRADDKEYEILIKLLLLGDGGVGKTSIMLRYSEDKFSTSLLSTAGVDYKSQYLDIEGKRVKCQIWDTAGQQRFHVITQAYYKGAHGIVLVYDVSDPHEER